MAGSASEIGPAPRRSAGRYLWWLVLRQWHRALAGALFGSLGMVGLMVPPYVLSRAVDDGLVAGDATALVAWSGVLLGIGVLGAWLNIMRHRTMSRVRMEATFRTVQVVVSQSTRLGAALRRQVAAGEVLTIGVGDVTKISQTLTIAGPGVGAVVAYAVVAALLLSVSPVLAAVVLVGIPVLAVIVGPLLSRLHGAEVAYREHESGLTARLGDIAAGLRVLNGLGGKDTFAGHYHRRSRALLAEGYRVGSVTSWVQALGAGLPVVFLAVVTWLAARMAAQGAITVGELVAVYGYVAVLVVPVSSFIEGGYDLSRGLVSARRVVRLLALEPDIPEREPDALAPQSPAVLRDPESGVEVAPGQLTALVSARTSESAAVLERLGRFAASAATWGPVRLDELAVPEVRERILVADSDADLFSGTLRDVVSGRRDLGDDELRCVLQAVLAQDVLHALPDALDSTIEAQGRNLSGGQRQRVRLARALAADADVLLAAEPTSALDAHTEAIVAARVREARSGRTTVVTSTSPLVLDQADTVHFLVEGQVVATGRHHDLLTGHPGYRELVARDPGDDGDGGSPPGPATPPEPEAVH